jgi:hypothetical protein
MSSRTYGADVPGIAKDHIKGKYKYLHSEEYKSSNQVERIQRPSVQLRTRDDSAQSSSYNRSFLEQNSSEETARNSQAQNMVFLQNRLKNLQKILT